MGWMRNVRQRGAAAIMNAQEVSRIPRPATTPRDLVRQERRWAGKLQLWPPSPPSNRPRSSVLASAEWTAKRGAACAAFQ
jgi:hypothetical protein